MYLLCVVFSSICLTSVCTQHLQCCTCLPHTPEPHSVLVQAQVGQVYLVLSRGVSAPDQFYLPRSCRSLCQIMQQIENVSWLKWNHTITIWGTVSLWILLLLVIFIPCKMNRSIVIVKISAIFLWIDALETRAISRDFMSTFHLSLFPWDFFFLKKKKKASLFSFFSI